jgi:hypothetical protein
MSNGIGLSMMEGSSEGMIDMYYVQDMVSEAIADLEKEMNENINTGYIDDRLKISEKNFNNKMEYIK